MTDDKMREAFEAWISNNGEWPQAVESGRDGYKLMQTASAWNVWQACAAQQAQEIAALRADASRYRWLRSITIHEWHRMANYTADALDAEVDFRNPAVRMEKP